MFVFLFVFVFVFLFLFLFVFPFTFEFIQILRVPQSLLGPHVPDATMSLHSLQV